MHIADNYVGIFVSTILLGYNVYIFKSQPLFDAILYEWVMMYLYK